MTFWLQGNPKREVWKHHNLDPCGTPSTRVQAESYLNLDPWMMLINNFCHKGVFVMSRERRCEEGRRMIRTRCMKRQMTPFPSHGMEKPLQAIGLDCISAVIDLRKKNRSHGHPRMESSQHHIWRTSFETMPFKGAWSSNLTCSKELVNSYEHLMHVR